MTIARFKAAGQNNLASGRRTTCLGVTASESRRGSIFELAFAPTSEIEEPRSSAIRLVVMRYQFPGQFTPVTPVKLSGGFKAAELTPGEPHCIEPTYQPGRALFATRLHPGARLQLYLPPGEKFLIPATAHDGVGITSVASSPGSLAEAVVHWEE